MVEPGLQSCRISGERFEQLSRRQLEDPTGASAMTKKLVVPMLHIEGQVCRYDIDNNVVFVTQSEFNPLLQHHSVARRRGPSALFRH
jgi:hypothetical protein